MAMHYLAWIENGFWNGQKLLTRGQISTVLNHLDWKHEVFETMQHYDESEQIVGCPIYADFDHKERSLGQTQADVQAFVFRVMGELNVIPKIYFSGNKGFHVVVPHTVISPHCHYLVRYVVNHFGETLKTLDRSVYRPRAMFRIPGSPASSPGYYKTQLTKDELFHATVDEIMCLASKRQTRSIDETDMEKLVPGVLEGLLSDAEKTVHAYPENETTRSLYPLMTPCMRKFLMRGVPSGSRNKAIFILAKFFKSNDVASDIAEKIMMKQEHIREWHDSHDVNVRSIVTSVYRSAKPTRIGCRTGADAELMQANCSDLCPFNQKFPELKFSR